MLRLERMQLCGFKSFGDRTEVQFPDGVTAIVGPNGCGKSNIGDAINWVLGEQSAKMLRGQQMADVIFSGSEARKAVGLAEVSLSFGGAEGLPGNDQGKIVVTRRLFRSGESEYQMNGSRTRLKDIQELLRQAKVGARTYATIEQGKIDQVLNAKPLERRALIEDAAGIAGYKHKRRLAELKLEATRANVLRVNDIVVEVQRQIGSLKRQAAKARRYRRLRGELRQKELIRFASQAAGMERELTRLRGEEGGAHDAEVSASTRLSRIEAGLEQRRETLEQLDRRCRESAERAHLLDMGIDRDESQIRSCRERIDESTELLGRHQAEIETLSARHAECEERCRLHASRFAEAKIELDRVIASLEQDQAELVREEQVRRELRERAETLRKQQFETLTRSADRRNRLQSAEEALERIAARRNRIEAEQSDARRAWSENRSESERLVEEHQTHGQQFEAMQAALAEGMARVERTRAAQSGHVDALAEAREIETSSLARLATLEDVGTRFAGFSDGVKRLLSDGGASGIRSHGVVADYVEASQEIEGAAESYLEWLLPTVILEDDEDACRAAQFLTAQGAGRTSMICRTQPTGSASPGVGKTGNGEVPASILGDRRVLGQLRERLKLKTQANGVIADRIGDPILVDSLASALDLHRRFPAADYLTPQGEVVYSSGVISAGGRPGNEQGLLAHKRRTESVRSETREAARRVAELETRVESGRVELLRLEDETQSLRQGLELAGRRAVALELNVARSQEEIERSGRQTAVLADELASLVAEVEMLEALRRESRVEAERADEERVELDRALADCGLRHEQIDLALKQRMTRVTDRSAEQAGKAQRLEAVQEEDLRLKEMSAELTSRRDTLRDAAATALARAEGGRELLARTEKDLVEQLEQRKRESAAVAELEREIEEQRETLGADETEFRVLRGELETLRERSREAELARTRAEAARQHLDDLCRQELGLSAEDARRGAPEMTEELDSATVETEIAEIKERIERIGPVNMTAIEEFSELEERYGFLTAQRQDLERSMDSLRETIRRINRESRQRFLDAFEAVRANYQEVFQLLFTGGKADLRLEEGEDVLECGIEILAQPPGKRLTGVHLLSGGEKALSAIALLFAIFRHQPSPFCLLDEVDAALDDGNVARFARMITEFAKNTQFVVITHNKLSMESANLLYGVTMEEPGVSKLVSLQLA